MPASPIQDMYIVLAVYIQYALCYSLIPAGSMLLRYWLVCSSSTLMESSTGRQALCSQCSSLATLQCASLSSQYSICTELLASLGKLSECGCKYCSNQYAWCSFTEAQEPRNQGQGQGAGTRGQGLARGQGPGDRNQETGTRGGGGAGGARAP